MSTDSTNSTSNTLGLSTLVFLLFLVLKLTGYGIVANWSWWAVTAPLWAPIIILLVLALLLVLGAGLVAFFTERSAARTRRA